MITFTSDNTQDIHIHIHVHGEKPYRQDCSHEPPYTVGDFPGGGYICKKCSQWVEFARWEATYTNTTYPVYTTGATA